MAMALHPHREKLDNKHNRYDQIVFAILPGKMVNRRKAKIVVTLRLAIGLPL